MKLLLSAALFAACSTLALAESPAPGGGPQGKMRFGNDNTPGWSLMTREEHKTHRDKMHGMKTHEECMKYHEEHMKQMEARAKEKGKNFTAPKYNGCDRMKERGMLK
jgi:hypothetical protein